MLDQNTKTRSPVDKGNGSSVEKKFKIFPENGKADHQEIKQRRTYQV